MPFLSPNEQRQSTEGTLSKESDKEKSKEKAKGEEKKCRAGTRIGLH